jgi:hypothetical protein
MPRAIHEVAAEIRKDWGKKDGAPNVWVGAVPYLDAMFSLNRITDMYGLDTGKSVVIYFLANAAQWRGETARRIKKELKALYA